ncbi:MAG: 50S ribosomal protein L6 [Nanoarchaeota archaeon]
MKPKMLEMEIEIPSGIEVSIDNGKLTARGQKGEIARILKQPSITIEKKENGIRVFSKKTSRKEKRMIGTFAAHIKNMLIGVNSGFVYKLKICSGHFPMKVSLEDKKVIVSNFLGERIPRTADIMEGTNVRINGDEIIVEGADKDKVSQTAANIERSTRITNRDRRVFMDGVWISQKA